MSKVNTNENRTCSGLLAFSIWNSRVTISEEKMAKLVLMG
jgi:hypothetical protein